MGRARIGWSVVLVVLGAVVACAGVPQATPPPTAHGSQVTTAPASTDAPSSTPSSGPSSTPSSALTTVPTTPPAVVAEPVLVDPRVDFARSSSSVPGVLTFRGNPTRSYSGTGPIPLQPTIRWRYPERAMCAESSEYGEVRTWCGTGWVGQPAVFEREGRTWVVVGAYDRAVHFVDGATGTAILAPLVTGDLAKGGVTVDPDGFPLIYHGSRDALMRIIAIDGPEARVLWSLDGDIADGYWNNDWDGAPLVIDDTLLVGGENSWFYGIRLHRSWTGDDQVAVAPEPLFRVPGFDSELLAAVGDRRVSIESSVAVSGDIAYFANSGGLLQGWDISMIRTGIGEPERVLRLWTGDDTDATPVIDADGNLYIGVEVDRVTQRSQAIGQLLKIDPDRLDGAASPDDAIVWSVDIAAGADSGTWSTAAIWGDLVIWPTKPGRVYAIDRASGSIRWTLEVSGPVLSSAVVVDDHLIVGDGAGILRAWNLAGGTPALVWELALGATIESTPVVWNGMIYLGTRGGHLLAIG